MRQMIVKKGSFASCHRISNHKGKCHNLHGHNYNYEIGISYDLEGTRLNECNYVIDFGELKELYTSNCSKVAFTSFANCGYFSEILNHSPVDALFKQSIKVF